MKISIEQRVILSRRKLQGALLHEDCSINVNPPASKNEYILPVAIISIPSSSNMPKVNSDVLRIIGEFGLAGSVSHVNDDGDFAIYLYARKEEPVERTTFREILEDVFPRLNKNIVV